MRASCKPAKKVFICIGAHPHIIFIPATHHKKGWKLWQWWCARAPANKEKPLNCKHYTHADRSWAGVGWPACVGLICARQESRENPARLHGRWNARKDKNAQNWLLTDWLPDRNIILSNTHSHTRSGGSSFGMRHRKVPNAKITTEKRPGINLMDIKTMCYKNSELLAKFILRQRAAGAETIKW